MHYGQWKRSRTKPQQTDRNSKRNEYDDDDDDEHKNKCSIAVRHITTFLAMHSRHHNLIYRVYNQLGTTANIVNLTTTTTTTSNAPFISECCHKGKRGILTTATATATSRYRRTNNRQHPTSNRHILGAAASEQQHHSNTHPTQRRYFTTSTASQSAIKTLPDKSVTNQTNRDREGNIDNVLDYGVQHRYHRHRRHHHDILEGNHRLNSTQTSLNQLEAEEDYDHEHGRATDAPTTTPQATTAPPPLDERLDDLPVQQPDKDSSEAFNSNTSTTTTKAEYVCKHALKFQQALPFKSIPGPRPSLPFVGTNWIYFPIVGRYKSMKLHEANMDKYHRYGPIMKEEYQRGYPTVTIFEPKDIKEVFTREGACPSRPVLPYVIKHRKSDPSRYPNVGLANMEGPEWFELRSRLAPLLLSRELKRRHINTQNRVSSRLVNYIKSLLPANQETVGKQQTQTENLTGCSSNSRERLSGNNNNLNNSSSGIVNNIQEVFYRFSMESIMNSCINQELGCLKATNGLSNVDRTTAEAVAAATTTRRGDSFNAESSEGELIFRAAMNFFEAQHKLYYGLGLWKYIESKPYRQLCDSENSIHDIASKYIDAALIHLKQKHEAREQSNIDNHKVPSSEIPVEEHESLLETLYCTKKFTDLEIKSTIVDFVGGGIYTVANTLTMCLFLLASNPSVQEQLYQEICQVFEENYEIGSDITIDMEKLERMKFLKLCLKESYRLLPTIPGVARTLQRDTVLSNYLVPKNTLVFCNFMVTCRLPQYFANPDEYNPSRWERPEQKAGAIKNDLAFCLLPFGHGVRKCIGHNFAELEIYVALAKLIRSFKINTLNGENAKSLDLCYKFIVVPEKPVKLEFTPRH